MSSSATPATTPKISSESGGSCETTSKSCPPTALISLTFDFARANVPRGWRHFVERIFDAACQVGVPFRIINSRPWSGTLVVDIKFQATTTAEQKQRFEELQQYV